MKRKKEQHPELQTLPVFHETFAESKNTMTKAVAGKYRMTSNLILIWKCPKTNPNGEQHFYSRRVNQHLINSECRVCNSLAYRYPELEKEWDYAKNKDLDPYVVSCHSGKYVFWICPKTNCALNCLHSWRAAVSSRTGKIKSSGCPFCSPINPNRCRCNSFGTLHLDILEQWDWKKNVAVDPYTIPTKSVKRCNWNCKRCGFDWETTVQKRVWYRTGCPECTRISTQSKGMTEVLKVLDEFKIPYEKEKKMPGLSYKNDLSIDLFIECKSFLRPICIEYDGEQHFRLTPWREEPWIFSVERDLLKNVYIQHFDNHLLRISFRYPIHKIRQLLLDFFVEVRRHEKQSSTSYIARSCPSIYNQLYIDTKDMENSETYQETLKRIRDLPKNKTVAS
jgi:hypothetical protein